MSINKLKETIQNESILLEYQKDYVDDNINSFQKDFEKHINLKINLCEAKNKCNN
jgi:hypothetical protein